MDTKITLVEQASANVPTEWGTFKVSAYAENERNYAPHMAIVHPDCIKDEVVTVRLHSECMTGDIFKSKKCDCGGQLYRSMDIISKEKGALLYLRQEGRGIGIINKLKAYQLQETGLDTISANEALGLESDYRRYNLAAQMLMQLGITRVKLLTNNPDKIKGLEEAGITVVERVPLVMPTKPESLEYMKTKADDMGHLFSIPHQ